MDQKGLLESDKIAERFRGGELLAEPSAMQNMKRFVALNKKCRESANYGCTVRSMLS